VLPGIDDGPETIEDSLALARAAAAAGTRVLVATPHVSWNYPNDAGTILTLVDELNVRLVAEGVPVRVLGGAEIAMTRVSELSPGELLQLRLGDSEWLLLEPPFAPTVAGLEAIVGMLQGEGHRVLLAHPERCPAFQRDPGLLKSLVERDVLTSITAGSLVGRFGGEVRDFALSLARGGLIHNVASDTHDLVRRPPGARAELREAGLEPLADWLTEEIPEAILNGGDIPPRPAVELPALEGTRRGWWRRRG
jgi:protein-tyrosine phosphatase